MGQALSLCDHSLGFSMTVFSRSIFFLYADRFILNDVDQLCYGSVSVSADQENCKWMLKMLKRCDTFNEYGTLVDEISDVSSAVHLKPFRKCTQLSHAPI